VIDDRPEPTTADSLPGLARVAATSLWRTSGWALQTYASAGRRLADVALHPDKAVELADDIRRAAGAVSRSLGGEQVEERVRQAAAQNPVTQRMAEAVPPVTAPAAASPTRTRRDAAAHPSLHEQGEELLRRSRDVRDEEPAHPAYERILSELAPDEARILTLLLKRGPQPSVDVRSGGPTGLFNSRLIAPGLNMIGARAGCRYVERVPSYLNNLQRLGLIWFSRETLRDPLEYQVVEAQPDVLEAMHSVRAAKVVRRSIHLTPFGEDFCRDALSLDTADFTSLPHHGSPAEDDKKAPSPAPAA
jgi:hypothetical protein